MIPNDDSLILLECFFTRELEKFIKSSTVVPLSKESRIRKCQDEIINFIITYPNSTFLIKNTEKNGKSTMSINISNIDEKNDHINRYIITVSSSTETFKVEKQLGYDLGNNNDTKLMVDFEKSKM